LESKDLLEYLLWLPHSMCCEVIAGFFGPVVEKDGECVDRPVHDLRVGVSIVEDGHEIISAPGQPSVQPSDVLEEAERVLHVGRLHQLTGSLGDRDVGRGGATAECANDVTGEAKHLGCGTMRSGHAF
jgi:hypothetical protein